MKARRVGLIGTGKLGFAVARRLLDLGLPLQVYNRTVEKTLPLRNFGAATHRTVSRLLDRVDIAVSVLSDGPACEEVLLQESNRWTGKILVQMGTIAPRESIALGRLLEERGGRYLEAPVLGSVPQALAGELLVMAAGDPRLFEECRPLLEMLGRNHCPHVGVVGRGAAMKLAFNHLIAVMTAAFAASHRFLKREGADLDLFMSILRSSALYAPTFDKKEKMMVERSFAQANFSLRHLQKDLSLVREVFSGLHRYDEVLSGVDGIIDAAMEKGLGECDYSALYEGLESR